MSLDLVLLVLLFLQTHAGDVLILLDRDLLKTGEESLTDASKHVKLSFIF